MHQGTPLTRQTCSRHFWRAGLITWAVLTLLGTGVHLIGWIGSDGNWAERFKPFANSIQMVVVPGWAVLRVLSRVWHPNTVVAALVANGIGWGLWWWGISTVLRVRHKLLTIGRNPGDEPAIPSRRRL